MTDCDFKEAYTRFCIVEREVMRDVSVQPTLLCARIRNIRARWDKGVMSKGLLSAMRIIFQHYASTMSFSYTLRVYDKPDLYSRCIRR